MRSCPESPLHLFPSSLHRTLSLCSLPSPLALACCCCCTGCVVGVDGREGMCWRFFCAGSKQIAAREGKGNNGGIGRATEWLGRDGKSGA